MASRGVQLRLDHASIAALADDDDMLDLLEDLGEEAVEVAQQLAPKDTGAGAASIFADVGVDESGTYLAVSYDDQHTYMGLLELGTVELPPRPFLRPALDQLRL